MAKISDQLKSNMVVLSRENLSAREIAERLGCAKSTVTFVLKKYRETGSFQRSKGSGRPRKTTRVEDQFIKLYSLRNRFKTSTDIRSALYRARGTTISSSLVRYRLLNEGLRARVPIKKPELKQIHRQKRLSWAQKHVSWTETMWEQVIFIDESKFKLHVGDGRLQVRRRVGERLSNECMQMLPPKSEGVMVWGCFSGEEKGRLCFVSSKVTADVYLEILETELEPSARMLFGDTSDFILQQDNAPCHTAKKVIIIYFLCFMCRMNISLSFAFYIFGILCTNSYFFLLCRFKST